MFALTGALFPHKRLTQIGLPFLGSLPNPTWLSAVKSRVPRFPFSVPRPLRRRNFPTCLRVRCRTADFGFSFNAKLLRVNSENFFSGPFLSAVPNISTHIMLSWSPVLNSKPLLGKSESLRCADPADPGVYSLYTKAIVDLTSDILA